MRPTQPAPLLPAVVAVSGDGCDAGMRFGAAEAIRDCGPLHVVHVVDLEPGTATPAGQIRSQAVERARGLVGHQVKMTSEIIRGSSAKNSSSPAGASSYSSDAVLAAGARDPRATSIESVCRPSGVRRQPRVNKA